MIISFSYSHCNDYDADELEGITIINVDLVQIASIPQIFLPQIFTSVATMLAVALIEYHDIITFKCEFLNTDGSVSHAQSK